MAGADCRAPRLLAGARLLRYTNRRPPPQIEVESGLAINAIFYPKYWLALKLVAYPTYRWTDGYTPGPDVFGGRETGQYYSHWGSLK